jgi:hypothetical protein
VVDDAKGVATWYVDGKADPTTKTWTPGTHAVKEGSSFQVGIHTSSPITGDYDLDDFRFYGRALNPVQVKAEMMQENPVTSPYDAGCTGPSAIPTIMGNSAPAPGNTTFAVNLTKLETGKPGVLALGLGATKAFGGAVTLPFGLDFVYGTGSGCKLHADAVFFFPFVGGASGTASIPLPIPAAGEAAPPAPPRSPCPSRPRAPRRSTSTGRAWSSAPPAP